MLALTRTRFAIQTEKTKRKGKPLQNFEVSEVEKEWVSKYTPLSCVVSIFSYFLHHPANARLLGRGQRRVEELRKQL